MEELQKAVQAGKRLEFYLARHMAIDDCFLRIADPTSNTMEALRGMPSERHSGSLIEEGGLRGKPAFLWNWPARHAICPLFNLEVTHHPPLPTRDLPRLNSIAYCSIHFLVPDAFMNGIADLIVSTTAFLSLFPELESAVLFLNSRILI